MLPVLQLVTVAAVPLNVTVPGAAPKLTPVIVSELPGTPSIEDRLVIITPVPGLNTVNDAPALCAPAAVVTVTFPVVAPTGTFTTMALSLQLVIAPVVPLNVTPPCAAPKFVPVIVMEESETPELGDSPAIPGSTVNVVPTLDCPLTVTTTGPEVAPIGTWVVIEVGLQAEGVEAIPLKATVLLPCALPKLVPVITTAVPIAAPDGVILLIVGGPIGSVTVMCESKLPFAVPSISSSPLYALLEDAEIFTPTHK
ncbi:MAG TPA: hypothetical protein VK699_03455 [Terriglobales bacterium]|nr:hypothetical protein [Terriglobales bacterium]